MNKIFYNYWSVYGPDNPVFLIFHGPPNGEGQTCDLLPVRPSQPTRSIFGKPFKAAKISSNGFGAVVIMDHPPGAWSDLRQFSSWGKNFANRGNN